MEKKFSNGPDPVQVTLITAGGLPQGEGDFRAMVTVAFDGMIDLCGAQRGLLRLLDAEGTPRFELARSHWRAGLPPEQFVPVESVIASALGLPRPLFEEDFVDSGGALRSAMAVPLNCDETLKGVVYLDRRGAGSGFPRHSLWPLEWFAQMVSVECSNDLQRTWQWRCINVSHRVQRVA